MAGELPSRGSTGVAWTGSAVGLGRGRAATASERGSAASAGNRRAACSGRAGQGARAHQGARAQGRPAAAGSRFFSTCLADHQGKTPAERRVWREVVNASITTLTTPRPQGMPSVERMCLLAGVSRAGYYRHFQASAPGQEETVVRDAIQRLALDNRHYGYPRISWS